MRQKFKTSTALIASLSLIVPVPAYPQTTTTGDAQTCADGTTVPCATTETPAVPAPEAEAPAADAPAADAAEPAPEAAPAPGEASTEPAQEPAGEAPPAAEAQPDGSVTSGEGVVVDPAQPAPADQTPETPAAEATEDGAIAPTGEAPATEPAVEPAAEPVTTEPVTPEVVTPEVVTEPAPEAVPATPEAAPAETQSEDALKKALEAEQGTAPATETPPATTTPEAMPVEPAPADAQTAPDEGAAAPMPAPTEDDLMKALEGEAGGTEAPAADATTAEPATPEVAPAVVPEAAPADSAAAPTDAEASPPVLPVQPDAATGEAPVAAAASAPEGTEPDAAVPAANVTEETVTEETTRSSSEDFGNKVNETAAAAAAAAAAATPAAQAQTTTQTTAQTGQQPQAKKSGLSDAEKIVLLGLGALAIGAIVSNNRTVAQNSGDRVVLLRDDGSYQLIKDDNVLLRQPGSRVRTEQFDDGSTRTIVTRQDGTQIVTIRDAEYRVLRRVHVDRNGRQTLLIDDTVRAQPVVISELPQPARRVEVSSTASEAELRDALRREADIGRRFSLAQVRDIYEVRALVPVIDLNAITFETGSAAIRPDQARALSALGGTIQSFIRENPGEMFLIEGHTDAVGNAAYNLALSDRRAESVALALSEYFDVPPENMVVQGYGEQFLKVQTEGAERQNRRASVRRITGLLQQGS